MFLFIIGVQLQPLYEAFSPQAYRASNQVLRRPLYLGAQSSSDVALELREASILLDKLWKTGNVLQQDPKDPAYSTLKGYLDALVDNGSPVLLSEIVDDAGLFEGRWKLAFSNDPTATVFGNPVVGNMQVFLDVQRRERGEEYGTVIQRIDINGKPGLRGQGQWAVNEQGTMYLKFSKVTATVMSFDVETPKFLVDQMPPTPILTSWFDGALWIERFRAEGDGGTGGFVYSVYRSEGGL